MDIKVNCYHYRYLSFLLLFRFIDSGLMEAMSERGVDLIVLEGMGRAVHTNLHAAFAVDALKVAVLKNKWLANRLGGDMFSVMFKFERAKRVIASQSSLGSNS